MILVQRVVCIRAYICSRAYSSHPLKQRISRILTHLSPQRDHPWHSVTTLPTLDSAVAHLESLSAHTPSLDAASPPPAWLLVRLCYKVRSSADAEKASHLIVTYLPHVPPPLRPPMLILLVHLLSTYRVLPELERIIRLFIGLPIFHEYWHFNCLLRALILYTDSPTDGRYVARLAVSLLNTMTERELSLTKKTYHVLLRNRYVTMELTEQLRQRMIRDKIVPDRVHLESFLRIFAHHGPVHDAAAYAGAIRDLDQSQAKSPHVTTLSPTEIVPSTTVEYLSRLVHENSQRTQYNADVEWSRFLNTGHSHRFLNKQDTSAAAWAARLLSLSRTWSFSPESLVAFFDWSHAQRFPFRTHTTLSYTIVLRGLLRKRAYTLALDVWERYRRHGTRKLHLDHVALGVGVEVLTHAGHPDRALALIDTLVSGPGAHRTSKRQADVPAPLVTRFMRVLSATNPSAALRLWEHMGVLYDTTPDAHAFTIMLDAARHATLNGESFAGAMQELGFGFDLPFRLPFSASAKPSTAQAQPEPTNVAAESLVRARRRSYAKLEKALTVSEGDMWGGERAWRRAHRIFTTALCAAWPSLADVHPPARAVRPSGESTATAPLRDLKRFFAPHDDNNNDAPAALTALLPPNEFNDDDGSGAPPPPPPLLPLQPRGAYPSFVPDDATFRASILLLGASRAASEIPRTLTWMRSLDIAPRVRTLAYALVFWAEVSVGAPLIERMSGARGRGGGDGGGEYARLVRWLEEWVEPRNLPDEVAIGEAMRRVDAMRRGHNRERDRRGNRV